jgi:hypothetical protein
MCTQSETGDIFFVCSCLEGYVYPRAEEQAAEPDLRRSLFGQTDGGATGDSTGDSAASSEYDDAPKTCVVTPAPTMTPTESPTLTPTHMPTEHPCDDGSHSCDTDTTACVSTVQVRRLEESEGSDSSADGSIAGSSGSPDDGSYGSYGGDSSFKCVCLEGFVSDASSSTR